LSGSPVEERAYQENNGTSFTTWNPDVEKVLTSSSLADTTDPALTIGEVATFTIAVHVPEGTTNTLQVIDDLPLGMAYVDGSAVVDTTTDRTATAIPAPTISTSGANGGTVTFDFMGPIVIVDADPLTEDDTFEITLQATLLNDVNNQTGGKLDNQVTVQADGGATLGDSATISIVEPDLNLTKSVDDATPEPEQEITYTLDLAHTAISTSDAYDVVIIDTLPAGLVFVADSATTPVGWSFSYDGVANTVTFTGDLPLLTATAQFSYRAVVDGATVPVSSTLTNIAEVDWTSLPGTAAEERNGTDGSGGALNDYHGEAQQTVTFYSVELVITKSDNPTSIVPSTPTTPSVLRYTINYSNIGNLDATNVVITETVPQYTTFNKLTSTGGDTLPPTGWSCADGAAAGTSCKFTFATLSAGASGTLDFDVRLDETVPANTTQILNTVTIAADEKEPIYTNNTDDEDTPLDAFPDMAVVKTDGVSVVASGVELTYTLTVRNNGSEGATGVVITDTLPAHVTYVTGSASPAYTSMDTTPPANPGDPDVVTLTWEISGEWAAGTERTFTYRVMVEDPMPAGVSELVNVAEVEDDGSNGTDPTPADNISTDTDYLATLPNTNLSKIIASTSEDSTELLNVVIGESLLYRITFVLPPGDLPGMTLSDALPQGLAFGECVSITSSSPLVTTSLVDGFDTTCSTPVITAEPTISLEPVDQGRNVVFNFGDVTNGGTENATLTLDYTVYVLDNADNIRDLELINLVNWRWGTDNDVQTQSEPVKIVEPTLSIGKVVRPMSGLPGTVVTYTLTVAHTPESNATAFDVLVEDILPIEMTYLPGTLQVISGPAPDLLEEAGAPVLQIGWNELPARDVNNNPVNVVIEYQAQINKQAKHGDVLVNHALVEWTSLPEDLSTPQTPNNPLSTERYFDPGDAVNNYGAIASAEFSVPVAPETGFAPGVVTDLSGRLRMKANDSGNLSLDIPAIGVNLPIVGIPANKDGWDLTWLGAQAGWLEGTAYPTWEGNTVITAHVYLPNGKPGPFIDLKELRWGSRFYILNNGMRYTYEVRIVSRVKPEDDIIFAHEDRDWVTLVTCAGYDEATGTYKWRDIVKAVLIKVGEE
jgi:LPXTG-site transpeptidase (sortase) family protein